MLLASLIQEEQPDYVFIIGELKDYFFFLKQQEMKCYQWQRNSCPGADACEGKYEHINISQFIKNLGDNYIYEDAMVPCKIPVIIAK